MRKSILILLVPILIIGLVGQAFAALQAVSPDSFITAALQNTGYPTWYQDNTGLRLELCILNNGLCLVDPVLDPPDPLLGVGAETFWWVGDAGTLTPNESVDGSVEDSLLVLAMEGAFPTETPVAGDQLTFGRVRIRINVSTPGVYTIIHPFGQLVQTVTAADIGPGVEINVSDDIGGLFPPFDFSLALGSNIGPFLFWNSGLPIIDPAGTPGDNFYIGDPAVPHRVLGSPFGTNFFRIERDGILVLETDQFTVSGKVFTAGGTVNSPPVVSDDATATRTDTAINIDVLANDFPVDIPINPTSLTIAQAPSLGTAAMMVVDGKVMVNYTPNPGASGTDSFTYNVTNFGGAASLAAATVTVEVEDLQVTRAEIRPKLLKWRIEGTSSDTTANTIMLQSGTGALNASLSGNAEVPPVVTAATGIGTVTVNSAGSAIDFNLSVANILNLAAAHIHVGETGEDGPIIFNLAIADFASPLTGTLIAADLQPQAAQGVNTFGDAIEAILAGRAYINVHTATNPGGEIRGQLGPVSLIGSATVAGGGSWSISGKSRALPSPGRTITVRSSNGVSLTNMPLKVK